MISNLLKFDKMYPLKIKDEDSAQTLIDFLECPYVFKKEVAIYNKNCKGFNSKSKYVFPEDTYCATYYDTNIPSKEEMEEVLKLNDYMVTAVAALDRYDKKRISLISLPDDLVKELPFLKSRFTLVTYKPAPESLAIHDLIEYLEGNKDLFSE